MVYNKTRTMKSARQIALIICVAASSSQIACIGPAELDAAELDAATLDEDVDEIQQEFVTVNGITINGITINGLATNGITLNGITLNGLTDSVMMGNSRLIDALREPGARELFTFIVSCALPEGKEVKLKIDGKKYVFKGEIGVAPEWGRDRGSCGESCQEWVSACLLSRVNYLGDHVPISIRGEGQGLSSTKRERNEFRHREAAYYGNIFLKKPRRYACLAPGQRSIPRVCGQGGRNCVVDIVGRCDEVCDPARSDGSFPNCRDHEPSRDRCGRDIFPKGTKTYKASITVFLED